MHYEFEEDIEGVAKGVFLGKLDLSLPKKVLMYNKHFRLKVEVQAILEYIMRLHQTVPGQYV